MLYFCETVQDLLFCRGAFKVENSIIKQGKHPSDNVC